MCFDQNTAQGSGLVHYKEALARYRGSQVCINIGEAYKIIKYPNGNDDFILKQVLNDYFHLYGNGMYPAGAEYFF